MVNYSFGISGTSSMLGERSTSFSRINTWTAKKISDSSLGLFSSLSRSNLFAGRSEANAGPSANANEVFTQPPPSTISKSQNMFLSRIGPMKKTSKNDDAVTVYRPQSVPKPSSIMLSLPRARSDLFASGTGHRKNDQKSPENSCKNSDVVISSKQRNNPISSRKLAKFLSRGRSNETLSKMGSTTDIYFKEVNSSTTSSSASSPRHLKKVSSLSGESTAIEGHIPIFDSSKVNSQKTSSRLQNMLLSTSSRRGSPSSTDGKPRISEFVLQKNETKPNIFSL